MRGKYQVVLLALLAFGLLIAPITARAGTNDGDEMQLSLCNSSTTSAGICGAATSDGGTGTITFGNVVVGNWDVNRGNAFGSDGGLSLPNFLDLSSFDATSSGPGDGTNALKLQLTITGLTGPLSSLSALNTIGGTNNGTSVTVTSQAWISTTNSAFCVTGCSSLTSLLTFTTAGHQPFAGSGTGASGPTGNPYSLTLVITISSATADSTSFDSELSQVPEPATLSVLGAGLLALGTGLRRKLLKG